MRPAKSLLTLGLLLAAASASSGAVFAADDGSMDTMWTDQPGKASGDARRTSMTTGADDRSTGGPLCDLQTFKQSGLVRSGGWPGVGPFHENSASEMQDDAQNTLRLETASDSKITGVQMNLSAAPTNVLKLQMSVDFLLESLGAKSAKIAELNSQFEKTKQQLMSRSASNPLSLTAGRYTVFIFPDGKPSKDKANFVVKVGAKEGSSDIASATTPATSTTTTASTPTTGTGATGSPQPGATNQGWDWTSVTGTGAATSTPTATGTTKPRTTTTKPTTPATNTTTTTGNTTRGTGTDSLKDQFVDLINNWQKIKKVAVRQRDTNELATVLSGKALAKQTDAIKWLQTNHKYYDMSPRGVVVDHYSEVVKGQKYAVFAQVKEQSKYIDEATGQVLKDATDTYNVTYTIEKLGDHWSINDSAVPSKSKP
jgi:hypothetical protein